MGLSIHVFTFIYCHFLNIFHSFFPPVLPSLFFFFLPNGEETLSGQYEGWRWYMVVGEEVVVVMSHLAGVDRLRCGAPVQKPQTPLQGCVSQRTAPCGPFARVVQVSFL